MPEEKNAVLGADEMARTITRMAHEIVEKAPAVEELALIGIRSRGVHLARRIGKRIEQIANSIPPVGELDVTPYRDDRPPAASNDSGIHAGFSVEEKTVVLIDDVIFRGRTIRAALEAVARLGQPKRIFVAVLIDRGARELPIRADIVGKNIDAGEGDRVNVLLTESDGIDQVTVGRWQGRMNA